jgi:hypothetical protein
LWVLFLDGFKLPDKSFHSTTTTLCLPSSQTRTKDLWELPSGLNCLLAHTAGVQIATSTLDYAQGTNSAPIHFQPGTIHPGSVAIVEQFPA